MVNRCSSNGDSSPCPPPRQKNITAPWEEFMQSVLMGELSDIFIPATCDCRNENCSIYSRLYIIEFVCISLLVEHWEEYLKGWATSEGFLLYTCCATWRVIGLEQACHLWIRTPDLHTAVQWRSKYRTLAALVSSKTAKWSSLWIQLSVKFLFIESGKLQLLLAVIC